MAEHTEIRGFRGRRWQQSAKRWAIAMEQARLPCRREAGILVEPIATGGDMGRLDGKVAVVTGATSGIGLHTAELFVAEGAKIVTAGRRVPEGEALAKKLGTNCIFRQIDVTVEEQMKALIAVSAEKFGRIDCLFNNAGGPAQTGGRNWSQQQRVWCYRTIPEWRM
jgi:threonine dehydrogenase-like Zn-dependent dehydrogenase